MMKRLMSTTAAVFAGLAILGLASAASGTADETSIKDVMKKLNGKGANESGKLKKALGAAKTDWDAVQSSTKLFEELGSALPKNDPPKGDKENWKKVAEAYASQCKALNEAAEKKDLAGTKAAFGKLQMSCMGCHQAHRGR